MGPLTDPTPEAMARGTSMNTTNPEAKDEGCVINGGLISGKVKGNENNKNENRSENNISISNYFHTPSQPQSNHDNDNNVAPKIAARSSDTPVAEPWVTDVAKKIADGIDAADREFGYLKQDLKVMGLEGHLQGLLDDVEVLDAQLRTTKMTKERLVTKIKTFCSHHRNSKGNTGSDLIIGIPRDLDKILDKMAEASERAKGLGKDASGQEVDETPRGNSIGSHDFYDRDVSGHMSGDVFITKNGRRRRGKGNKGDKRKAKGKKQKQQKKQNVETNQELSPASTQPHLQPLVDKLEELGKMLGDLSTSMGALMADPRSAPVPIPDDLLTTRKAAKKIFDLLCRNCPNKKHDMHQLLLGLVTEPVNKKVHFYLALRRGRDSEPENLWFKVSILASPEEEDAPPPDDLGFKFCLSNHAQYTSELAVSLDAAAHQLELFYPDQSYLGQLHAPKLLSDRLRNKEDTLSKLEKVRWMRLIAEAVLKFGVLRGLSLNLDAEKMRYCEAPPMQAYHWEAELKKQSQSNGNDRDADIADTLRKLGKLFLSIVLSPNQPTGNLNDDLKAVEEAGICGTPFKQALEKCLDGCMHVMMSYDRLEDEDAQKQFYNFMVDLLNKEELYQTKQEAKGEIEVELDWDEDDSRM